MRCVDAYLYANVLVYRHLQVDRVLGALARSRKETLNNARKNQQAVTNAAFGGIAPCNEGSGVLNADHAAYVDPSAEHAAEYDAANRKRYVHTYTAKHSTTMRMRSAP